MNCLNSSVSKDGAAAGAIAGAGVGVRDITGIGVGVPLPSVGTAPVSSSLPRQEGFDKSYDKQEV